MYFQQTRSLLLDFAEHTGLRDKNNKQKKKPIIMRDSQTGNTFLTE
jgi:hypothetical protein